MNHRKVRLFCGALVILSLVSLQVKGETELSHFGFGRVDYGIGGDRYGSAGGSDTLGVSKLALGTQVVHEKRYKLVVVVGAESLSTSAATGPNIGIQDTFIVIDDLLVSGLSLSVGAQPLFFGLKPNGFPGDRSLQPSLEFGGAGAAFAPSNQAGPSIILNYNLKKTATFSVGLFDTAGSTMIRNFFGQAKIHELFVKGLYAVAGYEYIDSAHVIDAGLGFDMGLFDLSAEYIFVDSSLAGLTSSEHLLIGELTLRPFKTYAFYFDFGRGFESELMTIRGGAWKQITGNLRVTLEYSYDDVGATTAQSGDARLTYEF